MNDDQNECFAGNSGVDDLAFTVKMNGHTYVCHETRQGVMCSVDGGPERPSHRGPDGMIELPIVVNDDQEGVGQVFFGLVEDDPETQVSEVG